VLHVQEERGQSTLGGIRVRLCALALSLVLASSRGGGDGAEKATLPETSGEVGECGKVDIGSILAKNRVGVVDVCARQFKGSSLQLRQAGKNLLIC
jgi:hypothetical protein